ncbi:MAG: thiamine pyrophosphate-binding protein [Anaerolineae bacterium]|nr:thiamine pyrophosphate-binding protein [Anaerolineae bacterium]
MAASTYYSTLQGPTVAQLLLRYLQLEGATTIFGVPGGALKNLLEELKNQRDTFDYVICKQETGAGYIADGYNRVTGKLGVVMITSGPGATNAVTGAVNAQNSFSSLLVISGEVPEQYFGMGYLQEGIDALLNVDAIYRNSVGYSAVITNPLNFQTLFTQALRESLSIPGGASHISLPDDVSGTQLTTPVIFPTSPNNYRAVPTINNPEKVAQAFQHLTQARHPLLFLGNGSRRALQGDGLKKFLSFVEKFAIPVMTSPDAKGIFPETHPLSLRTYGLAGCGWTKAYMAPQGGRAYDALMVMGSTLGELTTSMWSPELIPNGPFIQVDIDQSVIARAFPVELGIVAEIGNVIEQLSVLSERTRPNQRRVAARQAFIAQIKQSSPYADPAARDSQDTPIHPAALMKCITDMMPAGEGHIFVDSGNCVGWALNYLDIAPPIHMHIALTMGPMGFGVGSVLGGKVGAPDVPCVGIVGDGAFMMHGSEVSTATQYNVGAVWVVLSDNDLAMVSQGNNHFFPDPQIWDDYYKLGQPNIAEFARSLGADAYDVHSVADMQSMFPQALQRAQEQKKPQVIAAHINTNDVPPYYPPAQRKSLIRRTNRQRGG